MPAPYRKYSVTGEDESGNLFVLDTAIRDTAQIVEKACDLILQAWKDQGFKNVRAFRITMARLTVDPPPD
jgi:hypothetical protein